jgi:hypothetical protein
MSPKLLASLILLSAIPVAAQETPKSIALTAKSTIPLNQILKPLHKECPNVSIMNDITKSDYTLEATEGHDDQHASDSFDLTLFDREGRTLRSTSTMFLGNAVRDLCRAIKASVILEVVDTQNMTQSREAREARTDTSSIYVIVNGEHAVLDCDERHTGCATVGAGKYYGEKDGSDGIWVSFQMPLTHEQIRNHYKVAGSW